MAAFPTTPQPSFPVRKKSQPKVRVVKFADGFEHRIVFGLAEHQNPKEFIFIWKNISESESDVIESFLDARALDGASFTYTPPNESTSMNFKCTTWNKNMQFPTRATIQATFTEVFEP
tara:strand:+ start:647 stop:1000 length:354 start_codon:yes stop_codon:yes gene_type:complete